MGSSPVLRYGLPDSHRFTGAPLFNLATRAYSHDVDFVGESGVEAIRVHDILIIEYPTLILILDTRALVYNVAAPQASLLKAIIFEGFPPQRVICNQDWDFFAFIQPSSLGECAVTIVKKSSLLADEVEKRIVFLEKAHRSHTVSMNTNCLFYVRKKREDGSKQAFFLAKKNFWV